MASQPYAIPKDVRQEVTEYDPLVRIRWAHQENCWRVERKITRASAITPRVMKRWDDWVCFRDGYVMVFRVPPFCRLDKRIIWSLEASDIWKHGGATAYADKLDELGNKDHFRAEREMEWDWRDKGSSLYDSLKWRNRERVSFYGGDTTRGIPNDRYGKYEG